MKKTLFTGVGVAIITPFNETGIDFAKLEQLIEFQIENKTDCIVICGTTGETPTMSAQEQQAAIKFTVDTVKGRIPVIAGAGSNNTSGAVNASKYAESVGVDGILSVVPYYNKPTQKGMYTHFETIANALSTPVSMDQIFPTLASPLLALAEVIL